MQLYQGSLRKPLSLSRSLQILKNDMLSELRRKKAEQIPGSSSNEETGAFY